ncbi:integrase [Mycobacterium tuberculosis variant bovis]|nr:integrase [Mycobacterium tuberculosis variant bovis]
MIDTAIEEMIPLIGVRAACAATGRAPASYYRAHSKRLSAQSDTFTSTAVTDPSGPRESAQPRALSAAEREHVLAVLNSQRFADMAPAVVYATLLDEGIYLCSESTMYRLLRERGQTGDRRRQATHPAAVKPELVAHQPNSVWSWDITKLRGPAKWSYYYLYVILDIFSRYVVGWMVASRESKVLAERLIAQTLAAQHISADQLTLHADRGSSMSSKPVALLLADLGVTKSHSRPHTSNDNPLSEAQFKTLKYRPDFPKRFESIEAARVHCGRFFGWYNHEHKHSGIGLHTPADVHYGRADQIRRHRATVLDTAYRDHLERIRSQTTRATRATGLQRDQPTTEGGPADSINPRKSCLRNVDRFRPGLLDLPAPAPVDLRRLLPSGQIR